MPIILGAPIPARIGKNHHGIMAFGAKRADPVRLFLAKSSRIDQGPQCTLPQDFRASRREKCSESFESVGQPKAAGKEVTAARIYAGHGLAWAVWLQKTAPA